MLYPAEDSLLSALLVQVYLTVTWQIKSQWWLCWFEESLILMVCFQGTRKVGCRELQSLGRFRNFRCSFIAFVLVHMMIILSLLCTGKRGLRVLMSDCICCSAGHTGWDKDSINWLAFIFPNSATSLNKEGGPALPFLNHSRKHTFCV